MKKAKKILRKCRASGSDAFLALLVHPNTPPDSVQVSPARRIFNRRTRARLFKRELSLNPGLNRPNPGLNFKRRLVALFNGRLTLTSG